MEGCTASKVLLPIFVLLECCTLLSSAGVLPHVRNPNRIWKRDVSEYPAGFKALDPFLLRTSNWGLQLPSFTMRDWSVKMMSSNLPSHQASTVDGHLKAPVQPLSRQLVFRPSGTGPRKAVGMETGLGHILLGQSWIPSWPISEEAEKRSIVLADDAAFREKSKMLTAMERQKWLNSYMQKLLVVNSN